MNKKLSLMDIQKMSESDLTGAFIEGATVELGESNPNPGVQTLAYTMLDTKSCIATVSVTLAGVLIITKCPTGSTPGATVTVGATAKNTGNVGNNSFVILITASRADNGVIIASGTSGNLNLASGATSAEFTLSYTMPGVNVNVAYELQADPGFSY